MILPERPYNELRASPAANKCAAPSFLSEFAVAFYDAHLCHQRRGSDLLSILDLNPSASSGQALAAALTQILVGGSTTYLYGNGRIAQHSVTATATTYFLGDALGSVRQLTSLTGSVTLARSYEPYSNVLSSAGCGTTSYAFTG